MALSKGDLVLVEFPFTDLSQTKLRSAIVLSVSDRFDEITLCFVSSQAVDVLEINKFALHPTESRIRRNRIAYCLKSQGNKNYDVE